MEDGEKKRTPHPGQDRDATELKARVQEIAPKHFRRQRAHQRQLEAAGSATRVPQAMENVRTQQLPIKCCLCVAMGDQRNPKARRSPRL